MESKNRISPSLRSEQRKRHVLCWPKNLSERGRPRRKASVTDNPTVLLLKSLLHCLSRPLQAPTSECFISTSGLGVGMTSREGPAKEDQRLWEMPLLPSQGNLSQMLGYSVLPRPVSRPLSRNARLSHSSVHCQEIRYYQQEEGGGGGHSYTCCPNLALRQKPLEIINPRPGKRRVCFQNEFSL